jgi:phospholipid transport system substrate-binding protein
VIALALLLSALQAGSAAQAVRAANDRVRTALKKYLEAEGPARNKARTLARHAVGELIDFDALARATLGDKWNSLSPKDRARYIEALRGAMEANYLYRMRQGKNTDVDKLKTEVLGEEKQGDRTLVKTHVRSDQDTVEIDYVMERGKKGWAAIDVITEGVSLAETYREQVAKLWPKKGLEGVISALEKKRKALEVEEK